MPTVADLERLEALVANLRGINDKQRGELIEAEAWNRLVTAVIDIGRATIDDASDAVPAHRHTDQVSLEWLDPKLRATILEGGNAASSAQLDKLQRQLSKFSAALDDFSDRLNRIQADVSGVATRDVEREATVGTALRRLDGVFDAREDVASLRGSLQLIEGQVRTAADLSTRLQDDNGEEIDFGGLTRRITSLEGLETRLTLPQGGSFDAETYARDLAQLRAELVTEEELRETIDNIESNFSDDLRGGLLDDARAAALDANADQIAALETDLRRDQDASIRELDASLDSRIAAATGDLSTQIMTDVRNEQNGLLDERLGGFETTILTEVDRRNGLLSDGLTTRIDEVTASIRGDVTDAVNTDLDDRLSGVDGQISGVEATVAGLGTRLDGLTRSINTTAARIETVNRELAAADARLNAQLTERITGIESSLDLRIAEASDQVRVAMRAERETEMAIMRDQLTTQMTRAMRDVARTEVSIATTNLRGEMTEIAQAEIQSETDSIRAEALEAATVSDAQLSGLVSAEVRRQTSDLDERIAIAIDGTQPVLRDTDLIITDPILRG